MTFAGCALVPSVCVVVDVVILESTNALNAGETE
jgi:hypothetical protein